MAQTQPELSRTKVVILDVYEQDKTLQMSRHSTARSLVDFGGHLYGKPVGQTRFDEIVENGVGPLQKLHDINVPTTGVSRQSL